MSLPYAILMGLCVIGSAIVVHAAIVLHCCSVLVRELDEYKR